MTEQSDRVDLQIYIDCAAKCRLVNMSFPRPVRSLAPTLSFTH